jgi:hypothetical protein
MAQPFFRFVDFVNIALYCKHNITNQRADVNIKALENARNPNKITVKMPKQKVE